MHLRLLSTVIATLFAVACSSSKVSSPSPITITDTVQTSGTGRTLGKVVSVGDGDTIRVRTDASLITVRLACIDAPETAQAPWGKLASDRLKELLPVGDPVELQVVDTDRYGRTVAEVFRQNKNTNLQMVREGQAAVYRQYLDGCSQNKDQYLQAELATQQQRLNFWSQDNPVMPWDFRRGKTTSSQPISPSETSTTTTVIPNQLPQTETPSTATDAVKSTSTEARCKDFSSQTEALAALPTNPQLDKDGDGIPCESLSK